jgi:hypothetical protein
MIATTAGAHATMTTIAVAVADKAAGSATPAGTPRRRVGAGTIATTAGAHAMMTTIGAAVGARGEAAGSATPAGTPRRHGEAGKIAASPL